MRTWLQIGGEFRKLFYFFFYGKIHIDYIFFLFKNILPEVMRVYLDTFFHSERKYFSALPAYLDCKNTSPNNLVLTSVKNYKAVGRCSD